MCQGYKGGQANPPGRQLSELLQVMIAYDHLPLEGLVPAALRLMLQLVMQPLPPQAAADLCSGYLWFLSQHLLKHLQVKPDSYCAHVVLASFRAINSCGLPFICLGPATADQSRALTGFPACKIRASI